MGAVRAGRFATAIGSVDLNFGKKPSHIAAAVALVLSCATTSAHESLNWALDSAVGYDQNPGLGVTAENARAPIPSMSEYTGGSLFYNLADTRLKAHVVGTAGYLDYLGGAYPGHTLASVDAQVQYTLVPKSLYWTLDETFGQATTNFFAGASALNSTNVNLLSTGPQWILPLSSDWRFSAGAQGGFLKYDSDKFASDRRLSGNSALIHDLSHLSSLSLQLTYQHIGYASQPTLNLNGPAASYAREDLFVSYNHTGIRNTISVDLGEGRVQQHLKTSYDPTARLTVYHRVSPYLNVGVIAEQQQSDTAQQFVHQLNVRGLPSPSSNLNYNPIEQDLVSVPLKVDEVRLVAKYKVPRWVWQGEAGLLTNRYFGAAQENFTERRLDTSLTHRFNRSLDGELRVFAEEHHFYFDDGSTRATRLEATLGYHLSAHMLVTANVHHQTQAATIGRYNYQDTGVYIGFRYVSARSSALEPMSGGLANFGTDVSDPHFDVPGSQR